jgi:hypothetical protein
MFSNGMSDRDQWKRSNWTATRGKRPKTDEKRGVLQRRAVVVSPPSRISGVESFASL